MIKAKVYICEDCLFHDEGCSHNSGVRERVLDTVEYGQIVAIGSCPWQGVTKVNGYKPMEPCEVTIKTGKQRIKEIMKLLGCKDISNKCTIKVPFTKEERMKMVQGLAREMFDHMMRGTSPSTASSHPFNIYIDPSAV